MRGSGIISENSIVLFFPMNTESHCTSQPLEGSFPKTDLSYLKSWPLLGCHVRSGRSLVLGYVVITVAPTGVAVSWMLKNIRKIKGFPGSSISLAAERSLLLSSLCLECRFELVNHLEGHHVAIADAQEDSILLPSVSRLELPRVAPRIGCSLC